MIYGIGSDIVKISRIKKIYDIYSDKFAMRILLKDELVKFYESNNKIRFLAMRFAAKEAIVKAMGTGFSKDIWLKDIGIDKDNKGKPFVIFSNKGIKIKESLGIGSSYISLSDDDGLVVAFSILMSLDK
tara:strand:- start:37524 stop:37910 length:387 start_codon:yes stop_codon:yes gene_type:complete